MKKILVAAILCVTTFAMAVEPNQASGDGDVIGTIQEPAAQNKKIIKKIMTRKKKVIAKKPEPTETK